MTAPLDVFKVPADLLNRLRWVMLWFNLLNSVAYGALSAFSHAPLGAKATAIVCALGYASALVVAFRRRSVPVLGDVLAVLCILGLGLGLNRPETVANLGFAFVTMIQLYGTPWRALARVLGLIAMRMSLNFIASNAAPGTAEIGSIVGISMASLFPHLLGRALGGLQASEARFKSLVQNASDLVFVTGPDAALKYLSPQSQRFLGLAPGGAASSLLDFVSADDRRGFTEALALAASRPAAPVRAEFRLKRAGGDERTCEALITNLVADENIGGLVLNVRDSTDRRAAEAALQANQEKLHDAQHEIQIAARIQTALLPPKREVPGFDVAAAMLPAAEVGGDYYDIVPFEGGFFIGVGDVAGHGLTAGLVMLMTQSVVWALVQARPESNPKEIVVHLNRVLFENIRQRLGNREHLTFTLFKVFRDGRVQYAGAHEDVLVRRAQSGVVDAFHTGGAWLGAIEDLSNKVVQGEFRLEKNDLLVLHTDGITEARNAQREEYGPERLVQSVARANGSPADQLCFQLMRAVETFSPDRTDDRSLVVARYLG